MLNIVYGGLGSVIPISCRALVTRFQIRAQRASFVEIQSPSFSPVAVVFNFARAESEKKKIADDEVEDTLEMYSAGFVVAYVAESSAGKSLNSG